MDPLRFLATTDEEERWNMLAVARAVEDRQTERDRNRAVMIANAVVEAFSK